MEPLLVDLKPHRVLDVLADRSRQTVVDWLTSHPQITLVSRDRATDYAAAVRQALPEALQVSDRFHLVKNLVEAVELVLPRCRVEVRQSSWPETWPGQENRQTASDLSEAAPPNIWKPLLSVAAEHARQTRHAQRVEQYEQILQLRAQKLNQREIAKRLGIGERTVGKWLAAGKAPEVRYRRKERSHFDRYAAFVLERWQQGDRNGLHLWREIQRQGYPDGPSMVYRFLAICAQERSQRFLILRNHARNQAKRQREKHQQGTCFPLFLSTISLPIELSGGLCAQQIP